MSEESKKQVRNLCESNGFEPEQTTTIIALVEHVTQPIMERYMEETSKAMEALKNNDPNWKRLAYVAEANVILGHADALATIMTGKEYSGEKLSS